jgi:methylenetetrahydrofolate reductase (NADPH)
MEDHRISELLAGARRPLLSYEFFPPKDDAGMRTLEKVAEDLQPTKPDFVSVTYGAGGSTQSRTLDICSRLRQIGYGPVMHHLTCVGSSKDELGVIVDRIYEAGLRNIMALRGDPPRGETVFRATFQGLAHANDLVSYIRKRHPDLCCGVAGYPETHQEALSPESDILYLKNKTQAGGSFVVTQLFYDNEVFYKFIRTCSEWGIRAPIIPGLLPPVSLKQMQRMTSMCKASLPPALLSAMEKAGDNTEEAENVGLEWTVNQIKDLLAHGVPGVHLYILNRSKVALAPALKTCFNP